MKRLKSHTLELRTFLIAFIIMTLAFGVIGIFPFGNHQIMVIDSWHQYYPFLQELHHKLTHGGSLFHSWNVGMGSNFWATMAYYAFSPVYLLSIIFPRLLLREFMMLATVFKIACAGAFFTYYLRNIFQRKDMSVTLFGLLYAFCGFLMGYYWDIMWMDAVALLPLIILGLHRILDGKGFKLYVFSLGIALISNFYIGYFVCEFIALYGIALYFMKTQGFSFKHFIKTMARVVGYSLLGIALSAVVLIPAYKALKLTYASNESFPSLIKTYRDILDYINAMLIGHQPSIREGVPNVFSGFLALYLMVYYFFSRGIALKEKLWSLGLVTFFILSFNLNVLDYIWHGFHFPNEVPYRYAFVFSLLIITWAYRAFLEIDTFSERFVWLTALGIGGYLIVGDKLFLEPPVVYASLGALALYTGVFVYNKRRAPARRVFLVALSVVVILEVTASAIVGTATTGRSTREGYPHMDREIQAALKKVRSEDDGFYRMGMTKWYSTNDPALYTYPGVSVFSSMVNAEISRFNEDLGLASNLPSNRYLYMTSTPLVNGLLGIQYFISRQISDRAPHLSYAPYYERDEVSIFKNAYALPMGFMLADTAYHWTESGRDPFAIQRAFVRHAVGENYADADLYIDVEPSDTSYINMDVRDRSGIRYNYDNPASANKGSAKMTFPIAQPGQYYVYMFCNRSHKTEMGIGTGGMKTYETRRGLMVDLGVLEADSEINMAFEVDAGVSGYFDLQVVRFNPEVYAAIDGALKDEPFEITEYTDTSVKGTLTAASDGVFYTAIPYHPGWTARVDGAPVDIKPLRKAMIAFPLTQGTHTIHLTYTPDGFRMGAFISLGALILSLVLAWLGGRRKGRRSKRRPEGEAEANASIADLVSDDVDGSPLDLRIDASDVGANDAQGNHHQGTDDEEQQNHR